MTTSELIEVTDEPLTLIPNDHTSPLMALPTSRKALFGEEYGMRRATFGLIPEEGLSTVKLLAETEFVDGSI
jgi:hypothetical protein